MVLMTTDLVTSLGQFFVAAEEEFDPNQVSPGVAGFVIVAALAVALSFLGVDFVRRLRRSRYRSQVREEIALELDSNEYSGKGKPDES